MDENKSFRNWKAQEVEEIFGLKRVYESASLRKWLSTEQIFDELTLTTAERLRQELLRNVDAWNEAALKFFFIGPFVGLIGFNAETYSGFLEQTLTVEQDGIVARGNVDFMVANGREIARAPFYVLHEYKSEPYALDPKGQLLVGMVAAQRYNQAQNHDIPIFGSYVFGRYWFFVLLHGNSYIISKGYDATERDDNLQMLAILRTVKFYIDTDFSEFQTNKPITEA